MNAPHDLSTFDAASPDIGAGVLTDAGFFLVDDAGGRFSVDRELGIVSVADEAILAREPGSVHAARLLVIEPSGERYNLDLKLRLTGRVPQVVGAEDFGAIAVMAVGLSEQIATGVATPVAPPIASNAPATSWTRYAAALGRHGKADLIRTRRAFITAELPVASSPPAGATLSLTEPPPAVGAHAPWSL